MSVKETVKTIYSDSKDSQLHSKLEDHGKKIGSKIGSFLGYYFGYSIEKTIFSIEYLFDIVKDSKYGNMYIYRRNVEDEDMLSEATESS